MASPDKQQKQQNQAVIERLDEMLLNQEIEQETVEENSKGLSKESSIRRAETKTTLTALKAISTKLVDSAKQLLKQQQTSRSNIVDRLSAINKSIENIALSAKPLVAEKQPSDGIETFTKANATANKVSANRVRVEEAKARKADKKFTRANFDKLINAGKARTNSFAKWLKTILTMNLAKSLATRGLSVPYPTAHPKVKAKTKSKKPSLATKAMTKLSLALSALTTSVKSPDTKLKPKGIISAIASGTIGFAKFLGRGLMTLLMRVVPVLLGPIGLALTSIGTAVYALFSEQIDKIFGGIYRLFTDGERMNNVWNNVKQWLESIWQNIASMFDFSSFLEPIAEMAEKPTQFFKEWQSTVKGFWNTVIGSFLSIGEMFSSIGTLFDESILSIKTFLKQELSGVNDLLGKVGLDIDLDSLFGSDEELQVKAESINNEKQQRSERIDNNLSTDYIGNAYDKGVEMGKDAVEFVTASANDLYNDVKQSTLETVSSANELYKDVKSGLDNVASSIDQIGVVPIPQESITKVVIQEKAKTEALEKQQQIQQINQVSQSTVTNTNNNTTYASPISVGGSAKTPTLGVSL